MDTRIGTCSECGGPVVVQSYTDNATPHCLRCGAIPRLPVIPMQRPPQRTKLPYLDDIWMGARKLPWGAGG